MSYTLYSLYIIICLFYHPRIVIEQTISSLQDAKTVPSILLGDAVPKWLLAFSAHIDGHNRTGGAKQAAREEPEKE